MIKWFLTEKELICLKNNVINITIHFSSSKLKFNKIYDLSSGGFFSKIYNNFIILILIMIQKYYFQLDFTKYLKKKKIYIYRAKIMQLYRPSEEAFIINIVKMII